MLNHQPIEKRVNAPTLDVHSVFYTIQGEGPFCGHPAVFIRLAGCNLQCPMCDTDYTSTRTQIDASALIDAVVFKATNMTGLVVITGGEPFRQNIQTLIENLIDIGFYVQVESNGTYTPCAVDWQRDTLARKGAYLVVSPKAGKLAPNVAHCAAAFKYVMAGDSISAEDGLPILALAHGARPQVARPGPHYTGPVYLQPMDHGNASENEHSLQCCVQSCMKYGHILQMQIHKLIGVP